MKHNFTKQFIIDNCGCYSKSQASEILGDKSDFTIEEILKLDIPLKDKAWFIRKNCEFTNDQFREFAIGCALCVLPIYESKYPDNKAPREAIEAAKAYLKNEIGLDELIIKRRAAAYATDAAAYAAAADAAYDAAYAAAAAAYAAAYAAAADAAYDAAYAAAAAAAADAAGLNYKDLLLSFFKEFTKEVEPETV